VTRPKDDFSLAMSVVRLKNCTNRFAARGDRPRSSRWAKAKTETVTYDEYSTNLTDLRIVGSYVQEVFR
jgi:hypothetical protein